MSIQPLCQVLQGIFKMNKQTIDSSGVVCEFLEVVIHTLLFNRKLYPEGIFTLKKKYGVPVHVSIHPELNKYISDTLVAVKHLLTSQQLKQVDICFFNKDGILLERFILYFKDQTTEFFSDSDSSSLQQLKDSFRALCLKMTVNSNFMKPLPEKSTFKILIHTTEASSISMSEDPEFQAFPWVEAEKRDTIIQEPRIIPVRNIETNLVNLKIYTEENTNSK